MLAGKGLADIGAHAHEVTRHVRRSHLESDGAMVGGRGDRERSVHDEHRLHELALDLLARPGFEERDSEEVVATERIPVHAEEPRVEPDSRDAAPLAVAAVAHLRERLQ